MAHTTGEGRGTHYLGGVWHTLFAVVGGCRIFSIQREERQSNLKLACFNQTVNIFYETVSKYL